MKSYPLSSRLRELRKERGLTYDGLKKALDEKALEGDGFIAISRDSLVHYEDAGKEHKFAEACMKMSVENLLCLANFYDVSVDWLLGRPGSVKHGNADKAAVCEYTGLSEDALESLQYLTSASSLGYYSERDLRYTLYDLLESYFIRDMCLHFESYRASMLLCNERKAAYNASFTEYYDGVAFPDEEKKNELEQAEDRAALEELAIYKRMSAEIDRWTEKYMEDYEDATKESRRWSGFHP